MQCGQALLNRFNFDSEQSHPHFIRSIFSNSLGTLQQQPRIFRVLKYIMRYPSIRSCLRTQLRLHTSRILLGSSHSQIGATAFVTLSLSTRLLLIPGVVNTSSTSNSFPSAKTTEIGGNGDNGLSYFDFQFARRDEESPADVIGLEGRRAGGSPCYVMRLAVERAL